MTDIHDGTATGRHGASALRATVVTTHDEYHRQTAQRNGRPNRGWPDARWNRGRDAGAVVLLVVALFLPWNVYCGNGVPGTSWAVVAAVVVVTVSSAAALLTTHVGPRGLSGPQFDAVSSAKLRLALNAPYLVLVAAFVGFTVVQSIRYGGTTTVAPGVGQGAWFGFAGALLSAQAPFTAAVSEQPAPAWMAATRTATHSWVVLAVLSALFTAYWRTQFVFTSPTASVGQQVAVVTVTVVYALVAVAVVIIGSRWILKGPLASRLAATVLGASSLAAGLVIWSTDAGREVDAFHGIAQATSTASVGFEGYLCWVGAAAVLGPPALRAIATTSPLNRNAFGEAARKILWLFAFWCAASVGLRITDFVVAISLGLRNSPYDTVALILFDGITAVTAIWLGLNFTNRQVPARVLSWLSGALLVMAVARVVVGVALAPRIVYVNGSPRYNPVFGNDLAQQLTSTFDVVLCGLAAFVLAAAIISRHVAGFPAAPRPAAEATATPNPVLPKIFRGSQPAPQPPGGDAVTQQLPTSALKIFRGSDAPTQHVPISAPAEDSTTVIGPPVAAAPDKDATQQLSSGGRHGGHRPEAPKASPAIQRLLEESSQRFGAGTTYGGNAGGRLSTPAPAAPARHSAAPQEQQARPSTWDRADRIASGPAAPADPWPSPPAAGSAAPAAATPARLGLQPHHALWIVAALCVLASLVMPPVTGWLLTAAGCVVGGWYTASRQLTWPPDVQELLVSARLAPPAAAPTAQRMAQWQQRQRGGSGAAGSSPIPFRAMSLTELYGGAFKVVVRNWPALVGIPVVILVAFVAVFFAIAVVVFELIFSASSSMSGGVFMSTAASSDPLGTVLAMMVVYVVVVFAVALPTDALLIALSVIATDKAVRGEPVRLTEVLRMARQRMFGVCRMTFVFYSLFVVPELLLTGIVSFSAGIGSAAFMVVLLGIFAFSFVTGILLSLCPIVLLVEGRGVLDSMKRSIQLTKPAWGRLLGVHLLWSVASVPLFVLSFLVGFSPLLYAVAIGFMIAYFRSLQMLIYTDLRIRQEHYHQELLADWTRNTTN